MGDDSYQPLKMEVSKLGAWLAKMGHIYACQSK